MDIFINNNEQRLRAGWRLLAQFLLMFVLISLGVFVSQFMVSDSFMATIMSQFTGITLSVWIAARWLDKRSFFDYGLTLDRRWRNEFLIGTGIAAFAMGTIFLLEWSAGWITITGFGWNSEAESSFVVSILSFFLGMLMVGFHEELVFRGYQVLNITEGVRYPSLGHRGALIAAVLVTSSIFGIMHVFNPNASLISTFNIILAGVILAVPYILTGSLSLSVGLHFSWNFMMAGVWGFPVSGMEIEYSIIHIKQGGTELWTGGAFGPEAGLMGLLGMAIMLGGSCVYIRWAEGELAVAELFKKDEQSSMKSGEQTL